MTLAVVLHVPAQVSNVDVNILILYVKIIC